MAEGTVTGAREIADAIAARAAGDRRLIVAIAGPPAAGKSTLSAALVPLLPAGSAVVVPMDGFHYDDAVLRARGLASRKGSPETFDFDGLEALLRRVRADGGEVAVPVFDRSMELARAGAAIVERRHRIVLVEGNYLLLDEEPWRRLARPVRRAGPGGGEQAVLDISRSTAAVSRCRDIHWPRPGPTLPEPIASAVAIHPSCGSHPLEECPARLWCGGPAAGQRDRTASRDDHGKLASSHNF